MFLFREPSAEVITALLAAQQHEAFTYAAVGASRESNAPASFNQDHNRICLGKGEATFIAAGEALRRWQMFQLGWVKLFYPDAPIAAGTVVAMAAHCYGGWWMNACRIVYVLDESGPMRKFGFAYGTLPHHVECGEERFTIEWQQADDSVWYDLWAFSRPRHPLVRLAAPLARGLQRKFARDSLAAMVRAVRETEEWIRGCDLVGRKNFSHE